MDKFWQDFFRELTLFLVGRFEPLVIDHLTGKGSVTPTSDRPAPTPTAPGSER